MIATVYKKKQRKLICMYATKYTPDYSVTIYNGYGKGFLVKYMIFTLRKRMTANYVGNGQNVAS